MFKNQFVSVFLQIYFDSLTEWIIKIISILLNTGPNQFTQIYKFKQLASISKRFCINNFLQHNRSNTAKLSKMQAPTSDPKSSNMVFMLQKKITNPSPQQLKILTQLEENIPKTYRPQDNFKLAQITIYTEKTTFEGQLTGKCIAKQLSWNAESMNTLLQCLMGKRDKVEFKFIALSNDSEILKSQFEIICQISSGINLTLFTIQMFQPQISHPFMHMKQKFSCLQNTFRLRQKRYKEREQKLKIELNEIEAVERQIIYSSTTEINLMKKQFIKHINKEKAKIRKLMGTVPMINPINGLIESRGVPVNAELARIAEKQHQQEQKEAKTHSMKKNRQVRKVDRQKYERSMPQKIELESESQQKYFTSNSNYNDEKDNNQIRQNPINKQTYNQNRQNKFSYDDSSSGEEASQNAYRTNRRQDDTKKQKTFVQQQRQKLQNHIKHNKLEDNQNDNPWEQMFN